MKYTPAVEITAKGDRRLIFRNELGRSFFETELTDGDVESLIALLRRISDKEEPASLWSETHVYEPKPMPNFPWEPHEMYCAAGDKTGDVTCAADAADFNSKED